MADIELVIKIPEEDYERCKKRFQMRLDIMGDAIANGAPLPADHGRIGDLDALIKQMDARIKNLRDDKAMWEAAVVEAAINELAQVLVEADTENKEQGGEEKV